MAKDRRSRDQKRRERLEKRNRKSIASESLAYTGTNYRTEKLISSWLQAEIGIYESFIISDRRLRDQTVVTAIERLINKLREEDEPTFSCPELIEYDEEFEDDLVMIGIESRLSRWYANNWQPPNEQIIGVLRSILGSLASVRAPGPQSQSYLYHIAGFLTKKFGVTVKKVSSDMTPLPEPEEDELVEIGRRWIADGDAKARADFLSLANHLIADGSAERVVDASHQLLGEGCDPSASFTAELSALSIRASRALAISMG